MTVVLSALAFFILLSVLILIHEWGHYYAAKRSGVEVQEFGFGLPPQAKVLFKHDGTDFSLNWIPFGGFVRLKGENALTDKEHKAKGSFGAASIPARCVILCAGVFMNFLLALAILTFGFSVGKWVPTYQTLDQMEAAKERGVITYELAVLVNQVISGGEAAKAGFPDDAIITSVDGAPVDMPEDVASLQQGKDEVTYEVLLPPMYEEAKQVTVSLEDGKAGISLSAFPLHLDAPYRSPILALGLAFRESWVMMVQTVNGMGNLFFSLASTATVPEGITGIVGIAKLTHDSVVDGFMTYLRLVALLSLSLAALNILPFPALDGGRLLFVLVEAIGRKPLNRKFEIITNGVGFLFLILLIILITYYDIIRLFFS